MFTFTFYYGGTWYLMCVLHNISRQSTFSWKEKNMSFPNGSFLARHVILIPEKQTCEIFHNKNIRSATIAALIAIIFPI